MAFKYQKRDFEDSRRRTEQNSGSNDSYLQESIKIFKPSEGENVLRILPPSWDEANHYGMDIFVHYGVGPENSAFLCLRKMKNQPCPICEERDRLEATEEGKDLAKRLRVVKRVLFYLVNRDKEGEGVRAWAAPWTVDKDIMVQAVDPREHDCIAIDDPEEGYDVRLTKTGQGEQTKYTVALARKPSRLRLSDEILDYLENKPLPSMLKFFPYDYIKGKFMGSADNARSSAGRHSAPAKPSVTWEQVHALSGRDLDNFISKHEVDVDSASFDSDEELADAVCEKLGIRNTEEPRSRSSGRRSEAAPVRESKQEVEEEDLPFEKESPAPAATTSLKDKLRALREKQQG